MGALRGDAEQTDELIEAPAEEWPDDGWDALAPAPGVRDGKLVEGRDDFLFLGNDSYDVLAQHSGARRLGEAELEGWRKVLERRTEMLARRGGAHIVMVVPNNHSVYPEKLPDGTESAPERPVHQLMAHLAQRGSPVEIIYPLDELVAAKDDRLVCSRVDTHWTDYGAFLGYMRLMRDAQVLVPARALGLDDVMFVDAVMTIGDLGAKLDPVREGTQPIARVRHPSARLVYENRVQGTGCVVVTECDLAPSTNCLLLGDSYSYALLGFLPESFRRLVFVHRPDLPPGLLEREQPDILMSVVAERFLLAVPTDEDAEPQEEIERRKRAAGRVRPKRLLARAGPGFASVEKVEAIRSWMIEGGSLRDATVVSLLAYAGLSPPEVMRLQWSDVEDGFLRVAADGGAPARRVPLWDEVAEDLESWRRATGASPGTGVLSAPDAPWAIRSWGSWRDECFVPAVTAVGLKGLRPWTLHHTYVHLRLGEGATPAQVATEIGGTIGDEVSVKFAIARARGPQGAWEPVSGDAQIRTARAAQHARLAR